MDMKDFDLVKNLMSFYQEVFTFFNACKRIWSIHRFIPTRLCSKQFGITNMYVTKEKLFSLEIRLKVVLNIYATCMMKMVLIVYRLFYAICTKEKQYSL